MGLFEMRAKQAEMEAKLAAADAGACDKCDCDSLKKEIEALKKENAELKVIVADAADGVVKDKNAAKAKKISKKK